ncbi:hypothetical protein B1H10_07335 [candidate division KSB1 bacterium 4484_188]|nr:MAG: hypothetical protein B1H10_07335 [candidate division KSB1 bacterium 4484_188]
MLSPKIAPGDTVALPLAVKKKTFQDIVSAKSDLIGKLKELKKGDFKVKFEDVTIQPVPGRENVGRIVQGTAVFPTSPPNPQVIKLSLLGFRVLMDSLVISTSQAVGNMTLEFPSTLASGKNCQPTRLYLGSVKISQQCEFYVEKLSDAYGPFWIGNTGIQVFGSGFVADFSSTQSYAGASPPFVSSWKGVYLKSGQSIPAPTGTVYSNTGYAKGSYNYNSAMVTATGFKATLQLASSYSFSPTQPFGYQVNFNQARLQIDKNQISGGELRTAVITLPEQAVSDASFNKILVVADTLHIRSDGDLFGKVKYQKPVVWGEYTRLSPKLMAYSAQVESDAYFYLSASYRKPFWPFKSGGFYSPSFYPLEQTLDSLAMQGVTFFGFQRFFIYTPDTPGATPIEFGPGELQHNSWLNVVSQGVHGRFNVVEFPKDSIELGPTSSPHYVGKKPFTTRLIAQKRFFNVQFANSAVYNCRMDGAVHLKGPSQILLNFKKMAFTSTAHNAGGEVDLSTPDTLDYWGVIAVQKPGFSSAGLICVKTGQVILTAAGLYEPRHFAQPFYLTWGEMLADGNLGRLFFDYNTAGQKFDGFDFAPSAVKLSEYKPGKPGYLQAGGTAHFDFFGADYLNIHDFKYNKTVAPFNGRRIKLGFDKDKKFSATDTTIQRNWSGDFGNFNFNIAYDSTDQDGFVGKGLIGLNFVSDGAMDGSIVLSSSQICMSIWETSRHDFTLGPVAHFGSMASIWGCACIESGQLKRLMLGAELETTGNANVLLRSAAYGKLEYLVTPSVSELTINGNMYISIISGGNLEVTGKARFKVDRALAYVT